MDQNNKIPVLGVPILNRGDLLARMVKSIDYPVDTLYIVNNGKNDKEVVSAISELVENKNPFITNIIVFESEKNLGVAKSWNNIIARFPESPYWLLVGNDIQFTPGDLEKMHNGTINNLDHVCTFANHGHSFFAVTKFGLDLVGTFDENFSKPYLEDCDHSYRTTLLGGKQLNIQDIHAIHGEAPSWGSSTIYSDTRLRHLNGITHSNNFLFYRLKWNGINGEEKFTNPFNDPNISPKDWEIIPEIVQRNDVW